jgi:hypothetical protein
MGKRNCTKRTQQEVWAHNFRLHPEEFKPVDPEDFARAVRLGFAAASGQMPTESDSHEVIIEKEPGHFETTTIKEFPLARMWCAIWDHCGGDKDRFLPMFWRFEALLAMARMEEMKTWNLNREDGGQLMHPAMIEAAAVMPFDSLGNFNPQQFAERVAEIASRIEARWREQGLVM